MTLQVVIATMHHNTKDIGYSISATIVSSSTSSAATMGSASPRPRNHLFLSSTISATPTTVDATTVGTTTFKYDLPKIDRAQLLPDALKEYNKLRKNERQRFVYANQSVIRKKIPYVSIHKLTPSRKGKRREIWRTKKANQRKQHKVGKEEVGSQDNVGSHDQVGSQENGSSNDVNVCICKLSQEYIEGRCAWGIAELTTKYHLSEVEHDVMQIINEQGNPNIIHASSANNPIDLMNDNNSNVIAAKQQKQKDALRMKQSARCYGTAGTANSPVDLTNDNSSNVSAAKQQEQKDALRKEQSERRNIVQLMCDTLHGESVSLGTNANRRCDNLTMDPSNPLIADLWVTLNGICPRLTGKDRDEVEKTKTITSLVLIRTMEACNESNTISCTDMNASDFRALLTPQRYLTDATICFYSALLMERELALSLRQPVDSPRSAIYSPLFYTSLVSKGYNHNGVSGFGGKVPGTTKSLTCHVAMRPILRSHITILITILIIGS